MIFDTNYIYYFFIQNKVYDARNFNFYNIHISTRNNSCSQERIIVFVSQILIRIRIVYYLPDVTQNVSITPIP